MTKPFLQIRGIRKDYGPITAVSDVTLEVRQGEFLTFLGPSGSGKSTTLYILAGFQDPTAGDILLQGKSLLVTPSHKRNIGLVFQRYTLFPHLLVSAGHHLPRQQHHVLVDGPGNSALAVRVPFGNAELQGLSKGDDVALRWKAETAHAFCSVR